MLELKYRAYVVQRQRRSRQQSVDDVSTTLDALLNENQALSRRNAEYLAWEEQLAALTGSPEPEALQRSVKLTLTKPLTIDECHTIARKVYAQIEQFTHSQSHETIGVSVFGWTDKRRVDDGLLKFSVQKTFPGRSAYEFMVRTWSMVCDMRSYVKCFSASMGMCCEIVQTVDDCNLLIFHEFEDSQQGEITVVRSLELVTLLETSNGFVILYYSIDPSRLEIRPGMGEGAPVQCYWQQTIGWSRVEIAGPNGEHCTCSYAGTLPAETPGIGFWMVEVLLQALRWENLVIGPLLSLVNCSDTDASAA